MYLLPQVDIWQILSIVRSDRYKAPAVGKLTYSCIDGYISANVTCVVSYTSYERARLFGGITLFTAM
jgi:hypothetical protein